MSASLPPKSSNFRGVTLFKPSGKWRAQVGTGWAGGRGARGGAPGGAGDHDAARPGRRAGFAGCGCRGQPQCCHGIESGQLAGTPGGGGERGDAARRALRPTTPGRLFWLAQTWVRGAPPRRSRPPPGPRNVRHVAVVAFGQGECCNSGLRPRNRGEQRGWGKRHPPRPRLASPSALCRPLQCRRCTSPTSRSAPTTQLPTPLLPFPTQPFLPQISAGGKTTSLGDHETEIAAARAFDRAAINKAGHDARTNFPLSTYADEMEDLIREFGGFFFGGGKRFTFFSASFCFNPPSTHPLPTTQASPPRNSSPCCAPAPGARAPKRRATGACRCCGRRGGGTRRSTWRGAKCTSAFLGPKNWRRARTTGPPF